MADDPVLGQRMHAAGIVLRGQMTNDRWLALLAQVTDAMGMTAAGAPQIFTYPIDGKGGTGQTIFLPITESFLIVDTWPDHDGAYLFVSSCRSYDVADIAKVADIFGLQCEDMPAQRFYAELDLI